MYRLSVKVGTRRAISIRAWWCALVGEDPDTMAANAYTFLMLPPHSAVTRDWGRRLGEALPDLKVIVAESAAEADAAIAGADGVYGTLTPGLLAKAKTLRW